MRSGIDARVAGRTRVRRRCPPNRHARPSRIDGADGGDHRARRSAGRTDRSSFVTAVVTGGGSGIGAAVAQRLRDAGDDVVTWDLHDGDLHCDIANPNSVAATLAETVAG